jgi:hypothetical protein
VSRDGASKKINKKRARLPEHEELLVVDLHLHATVLGQQNLAKKISTSTRIIRTRKQKWMTRGGWEGAG